MQLLSSSRRGFTLIELLIVVVIIGILAVGLVPKVLDAPKRARDTVRMSDLKNIRLALQSYAADHAGVYPAAPNTAKLIDSDFNNASDFGGYFDSKKVPVGPKADSYYYKQITGNNGALSCYMIGAQTETKSGNIVDAGGGPGGLAVDNFLDDLACDSDIKADKVKDGAASNFYAMIVRY